MRPSGAILAAAFAAFGGLLVAGLLTLQHCDLGAMQRLCGEQGGCAKVLTSRYARIGPVPLAAVGAGVYVAMLGGLLACVGLADGRTRRMALNGVVGLGSVGVLASMVLMGLQFFIIGAICPLCTLSAFFMVAIAALAWSAWRRPEWPGDLGMAAAMLGLFIATGVGVAATVIQGRPAVQPSGEQVLARVDGREISAGQMDAEVRQQALELESRLYTLRRDWMQRKIAEALIEREAAERGLSPMELVRQEVDERIRPAAEALERWIAEQRTRDRDFNWYAAQSRGMEELRQQRKAQWLESLRAKRDVRVMLSPPPGMPLDIDPALVHRLGPEDATVKLLLFSDFECPYCAELAGVIQEVMQTFPFEVSLEYVHLPLKSHPLAFEAAVASEAAARQGKFWLYHDELVKQRGQLVGDWEQPARAIGLELERFRADMASEEIRQLVERGRRVGQDLGHNAVPVLYLNGRRVGGLLSVEELTQLVRLARAR